MERGTHVGFRIIADARQHILNLSSHDNGTTDPIHIVGPVSPLTFTSSLPFSDSSPPNLFISPASLSPSVRTCTHAQCSTRPKQPGATSPKDSNVLLSRFSASLSFP